MNKVSKVLSIPSYINMSIFFVPNTFGGVTFQLWLKVSPPQFQILYSIEDVRTNLKNQPKNYHRMIFTVSKKNNSEG